MDIIDPDTDQEVLFEIADTFEEIKSECSDGRKNIFNARIDKDGNFVTEGNQVEVGAEDKYISVSRRLYKDKIADQDIVVYE